MTAMSINSGYGVGSNESHGLRAIAPASVAALQIRLASAVDQASVRVNEWALDHLLDAAGGVALALLPFSFLVWMFVTR